MSRGEESLQQFFFLFLLMALKHGSQISVRPCWWTPFRWPSTKLVVKLVGFFV